MRVRMSDVRGADGTIYEDRVEWQRTDRGWETTINRSHLEVRDNGRPGQPYYLGYIGGRWSENDPSESSCEVKQDLLYRVCFD